MNEPTKMIAHYFRQFRIRLMNGEIKNFDSPQGVERYMRRHIEECTLSDDPELDAFLEWAIAQIDFRKIAQNFWDESQNLQTMTPHRRHGPRG